ncbi:MAG: carboxypeptidase regulatory-like domain-containing protein [Bryobacteraceae bacterium]|nr:carboxypeptidase regulatory-like domain-containing protein [Bryobacteraceae bacterium]
MAQTSRGTVTGSVTDATKAAVPGATVEIKQKETNIVRTTSTNESGLYRFDAVDPGTYDVTVKSLGFKTYASRSIPVSAAQILAVDAALEIGDNVTVVEVNSDAVALQTEAPVRGGTINSTAAVNLPVFSRNPVNLAITLPGVTEQRSDFPGVGTFSVNGSRGRSNNFLMDGTENNDISVTGQAFQIKIPDAVQEVSVQTANYDAEFGRAGGAVVNIITRSGTNELHGSLGWVPDFTNDDAITSTLSADPNILSRGKLPPGYQQFWYGTVGGPIKKDRTFFFTSWQEERRSATNTAVFTTPTVFGQQQIRTALAATPNANPLVNRYLEITGQVPGILNPSNQDLGNGRGVAQFGQGVYAFPYKYNGRQSLTKGDHRFSDKDMLSLRYGYDRYRTPVATNNFPGFQTSTENHFHNVLLTETHVFSPSLTNELRLPFNRIAFDAPNNATNQYAQMPQIAINGLTAVGVSSSYPQGRIANNYGLQDTISWAKGRHTIRTGFDLLLQRSRQFAPASYRGTWNYTASNAQGQAYSQFANFLDDFGGTVGPARDFGEPAYYPELFRQQYFVSDRWQIRPNMTLTLGVRYEDFGAPVNSLRTPAYTGLFNIVVDRATRTVSGPFNQANETKRDRNNFSPSIGLTWSPSASQGLLGRIFGERKTVFRTGFNMGYDTFFNNIASNASTSAPNFVSTNDPSTPGVNGQGPRGLGSISTRIPTTPRAVRPDDAQGLVAGDLVNPYYMKWSFGIQRELPWQLVLDSSYVGTSGVRLYAQEDLNPAIVDPTRRVLPAASAAWPNYSRSYRTRCSRASIRCRVRAVSVPMADTAPTTPLSSSCTNASPAPWA